MLCGKGYVMFDIELLIVSDMGKQLEDAERDHKYGYTEATIHRCKTVRAWCDTLARRLDEVIEGKRVK